MDPSVSGRGAEPVYRDKVTGQTLIYFFGILIEFSLYAQIFSFSAVPGERMSKDQVLKSREKKEEKPKVKYYLVPMGFTSSIIFLWY